MPAAEVAGIRILDAYWRTVTTVSFLVVQPQKAAYIAMCELGSLQSDWPVEPPNARTCAV